MLLVLVKVRFTWTNYLKSNPGLVIFPTHWEAIYFKWHYDSISSYLSIQKHFVVLGQNSTFQMHTCMSQIEQMFDLSWIQAGSTTSWEHIYFKWHFKYSSWQDWIPSHYIPHSCWSWKWLLVLLINQLSPVDCPTFWKPYSKQQLVCNFATFKSCQFTNLVRF